MTPKSSLLIATLSLIAFLTLTSAFDLTPSQNINAQNVITDDCKTASVYEYFNNFTFPLNEVSKLLANQFSRNGIADFEASNKVKLFNITATSKLLSNDQSQSPASTFKYIVSNSQIEFTFTYKLNITEGTLKKTHTFDAVTKLSNVSISYEKEYKLDTGSFAINTATVKIDANMMTSTFTPTTTDAEKTSFQTAIKGTAPSLFTQFSKIFSNDIVKQSMQTNCKGDHLSKVYPENPYNYQFYSNNFTANISIDLATVTYSAQNKSLTNGMSGRLPQGNSQCTQFVPNFEGTGATLYFSKEFVQNFVEYNIAAFAGWKDIKIGKDFNSRLIQWQLLDLDFIVDGLWRDLGDYTQNEIRFTCDIKSQVSTTFQVQDKTLSQAMAWACQGFVRLNSTAEQKVMDFVPRINHVISFRILEGSLSVLVDKLQIIDCQFNDVDSMNGQGKYTVGQNGAKTFFKFMDSMLYNFRIYPIGNRFKLNSNANAVQVEAAGNGLWII